MRPSCRLSSERLEDRTTPATFGNPWPDAEHLTLSFAPDGTALPSGESDLHSTLGEGWTETALRAFQTWAVHGNINLSIVADAGKPFGVVGAAQGASDQGDIRLGASPLSDGELAIATPFDWFSGWSGDVLVNSEINFSSDGKDTGTVDLFSVLLHEAGHVFGIGHSDDPNSPLYASYRGQRDGLTDGDIANLQSLYKKREHDIFDAGQGNNTARRATWLGFSDLNGFGDAITADLTTSSDVDYYKVTAPLFTREFTVALKTSGMSLLTPELTVTDAWGRVVGTDISTNPLNGDVSVTIRGARSLSTYTIKVEAARDDVFGIGNYQLAVGKNVLSPVESTANSLISTVTRDSDLLTTTEGLLSSATRAGQHWELSTRASLDRVGDTDHFSVIAPAGGSGAIVITSWGIGDGAVQPSISVSDSLGRPIEAEVLTNLNGMVTLQISDVKTLEHYHISVSAAPSQETQIGEYFLGVDFRADSIELEEFATGTLTKTDTQAVHTLEVPRSQTYTFTLSTDLLGESATAPVRLSIVAKDGTVIDKVSVNPGEAISWSRLLQPGAYSLVFDFGAGVVGSVAYSLEGAVRTDPIGPQAHSFEDEPAGRPEPPGYTAYEEEEPAYEEPTYEEEAGPEYDSTNSSFWGRPAEEETHEDMHYQESEQETSSGPEFEDPYYAPQERQRRR